jgi:hypothetical protein
MWRMMDCFIMFCTCELPDLGVLYMSLCFFNHDWQPSAECPQGKVIHTIVTKQPRA